MFRRIVSGAALSRTVILLAVGVLAAGCASQQTQKKITESDYSPRVVKKGQPVPEGGGAFKVGRTYTIKGRSYTPRHQPDYDEVGIASWYGADFHGRKTANGEVYNMNALSAAHKTLPLPTYVRVTNLQNNKSVVVRVNDRGPFAHGRIIDLSKRVADILEFRNDGVAKVRVQYVGRAPLDGEDKWLTTTVRDGGTDRKVAALDRQMAASAFATDGEKGAEKKRYRMASSTYSGRRTRSERTQAPAEPVPTQQSAYSGSMQIGAFSDRDNAERLVARASQYGSANILLDPATGLNLVRFTPNDPSFDVSVLTGEPALTGASLY